VIDPYKGLPRRIQIGYLTFRVHIVSRDEAKDKLPADHFGMCHFEIGPSIYLLRDLNPQIAFNTVLHEVRHAIHYANELNDESSEEDFVTRGTNGEVELWIRNPRFYTWQTRMLRQLRRDDRDA